MRSIKPHVTPDEYQKLNAEGFPPPNTGPQGSRHRSNTSPSVTPRPASDAQRAVITILGFTVTAGIVIGIGICALWQKMTG